MIGYDVDQLTMQSKYPIELPDHQTVWDQLGSNALYLLERRSRRHACLDQDRNRQSRRSTFAGVTMHKETLSNLALRCVQKRLAHVGFGWCDVPIHLFFNIMEV